MGYLKAIQQGAEEIYETDDDNEVVPGSCPTLLGVIMCMTAPTGPPSIPMPTSATPASGHAVIPWTKSGQKRLQTHFLE